MSEPFDVARGTGYLCDASTPLLAAIRDPPQLFSCKRVRTGRKRRTL